MKLNDRREPMLRSMMSGRARLTAASFVVFLAFLAAWEWGTALLGVPRYIVPSASACYHEFWRMVVQERLLFHTGITAFEVASGFFLGALLGMFVGYFLGMSPTTEVVLSPYILAMQIAPKVAFAPLFVMWFGFTLYPRILVAILIVFFPILVNVLTALRTVDPERVSLGHSFCATRFQIFWKIEFPSTMPQLFAGLRIGATLAVIGVVVGEIVGGNKGLGYLLVFGEGAANTAMVFVTIIVLTLIGIVAYLAVIAVERRVLHYLPARSVEAI